MGRASSNIRQVKWGAIFSYILIFLNTAYGLIMSPFILGQLGQGDYGVYKTIGSFAATLLVLDLGIGATVMRYTAKYSAEKDRDGLCNFAAMGLIETAIIAGIVVIAGICIFFTLDPLYGNSFSGRELDLAKGIYLVLIINIVFTLFENTLNGIITGMNRFVFSNGMKIVALLIRAVASYTVLYFWRSAVALVLINLISNILVFCAQIFYIRFGVKIKIALKRWDNAIFKESFTYTLFMLLQTLAIQANGNIDTIVIASVIGSAAVTVYSFGIQMFNMYENLSVSFSQLMLPSVAVKISENATNEEMQELVTKVGRIQFAVLGAALFGFVITGKEFISLWLGNGYEDVYYLTLIMIIPVTLTLVQNICLSILRAKNMMGFRTLSLIITAGMNAIVTIIGTSVLKNYYIAAIGTSLSIIAGSVIMMNIYYNRKLGFKVFKFYRDVISRTIVCILLPSVVIYFLNIRFNGTWLTFLMKVGIFGIIYAGLMWTYGLSDSEKKIIVKR